MNQEGKLTSGTPKLSVMKTRFIMRHLLQELFHVSGVPHEAPGRVFDGEQNTMFMALTAQLLREIAQLVCSCYSGLQIGAEVWQSVWMGISAQNWRVISTLSFNEPGTGCSATWRCKMHVDAIWMFN